MFKSENVTELQKQHPNSAELDPIQFLDNPDENLFFLHELKIPTLVNGGEVKVEVSFQMQELSNVMCLPITEEWVKRRNYMGNLIQSYLLHAYPGRSYEPAECEEPLKPEFDQVRYFCIH
jgi:hypothetical protein